MNSNRLLSRNIVIKMFTLFDLVLIEIYRADGQQSKDILHYPDIILTYIFILQLRFNVSITF